MPFQGKRDGKIVWPDEVSSDDVMTCLECKDEFHIVRGHTREDGSHVARHFRHSPDSNVGAHCHGGESNPHKLMKYVASRKFHELFQGCDIQREKKVPGTDRIADVIVQFGATVDKIGKGVIAECQHKNHTKNIEKVTRDYTQAGFSVYWLNDSHFSKDFTTVKFGDAVNVWPNAVPLQGEWTGHESPWEELGQEEANPQIRVVFPQEMLHQQKRDLKNAWEGSTGYWTKDNFLRLTHQVPPNKKCCVCPNDANFMFWRDGYHASFRCSQHLPEPLNSTKWSYNPTINTIRNVGKR